MSSTEGSYSPDDYLPAERAAVRLGGYKPNTLAKWRTEGYGPAFRKDRRRVFYRVGDLDAWSAANGGFSNTAQVTFSRQQADPATRGNGAGGGTSGARAAQRRVH